LVSVIQSGVMSGFDQWLSGGISSVAGTSGLPVWAAGGLAALLFCVGIVAYSRAGQIGRGGALWRVALVVVGAGLMWVLVDTMGARDQTSARRLLDARSADLTLRVIAPGSPLACLETVANPTVEEACGRALFANAETVAAAVAYVDARLTLLADGVELAERDRGYGSSIERLRRAMEADRFGVVAHVLSTRGCTADDCSALKLLRDPERVIANLRERSFDANVVLYAGAWRNETSAVAAAPSAPALMGVPSVPTLAAVPPSAAPPHGIATTGAALPAGFDFPSASSIPPISIMNAEPPLTKEEASAVNATPQAQPAAPAAPAAKPAAARRHVRDVTPQAAQAPQPTPSVPMPLAPPGTIANPR